MPSCRVAELPDYREQRHRGRSASLRGRHRAGRGRPGQEPVRARTPDAAAPDAGPARTGPRGCPGADRRLSGGARLASKRHRPNLHPGRNECPRNRRPAHQRLLHQVSGGAPRRSDDFQSREGDRQARVTFANAYTPGFWRSPRASSRSAPSPSRRPACACARWRTWPGARRCSMTSPTASCRSADATCPPSRPARPERAWPSLPPVTRSPCTSTS